MTFEPDDDDGGARQDAERLTPWDRRVLGAMATARAARTGVTILRVVAAVVVVFAVVGHWLYLVEFGNEDFGGDEGFANVGLPDRVQFGQFLAGVAGPLAFAGLVFAAAQLLAVAAARLDLDIVLSDEDEERRHPS